MVKSEKATRKFAKKHLPALIKARKAHQEKKKLNDRIDNRIKKRKRSGTRRVEVRKCDILNLAKRKMESCPFWPCS